MKKGNPGKTQEKSTLMKVLSCWQLVKGYVIWNHLFSMKLI